MSDEIPGKVCVSFPSLAVDPPNSGKASAEGRFLGAEGGASGLCISFSTSGQDLTGEGLPKGLVAVECGSDEESKLGKGALLSSDKLPTVHSCVSLSSLTDDGVHPSRRG